jgi:peptide/nickel transport system permease protein
VAPHIISNCIVVLLVVAIFAAARFVGRNPLWNDAARELRRRRPLALAVVGLYVLLGLCDSIAWVGGGGGPDVVAQQEPRTLIDRMFPDEFRERSYSAPLANAEFYGGAPLERPGAHLLGTDILGRDVLQVALKGARIALLIGGLTSLIVIPLALFFGVSAGYFGGCSSSSPW